MAGAIACPECAAAVVVIGGVGYGIYKLYDWATSDDVDTTTPMENPESSAPYVDPKVAPGQPDAYTNQWQVGTPLITTSQQQARENSPTVIQQPVVDSSMYILASSNSVYLEKILTTQDMLLPHMLMLHIILLLLGITERRQLKQF